MIPSLAREIVQQQPNPPRVVPAWRLLRVVLPDRTSVWLQGFAGLFIVSGTAIAKGFGATDDADRLVGLGMALVGVVMFAVPFVFWRRLLVSPLNSPLGEAEVQKVQIEQQSSKTIDALSNGFASGVWMVSTADGRVFGETFEVDEPFATQIRPGSRIQVLVHPRKAKSVFPLRLLNGA